MHARGRERVDVAGDVVGLAGEAAAGAVAIGDTGVVQRRLVGDGEGGEIASSAHTRLRWAGVSGLSVRLGLWVCVLGGEIAEMPP